MKCKHVAQALMCMGNYAGVYLPCCMERVGPPRFVHGWGCAGGVWSGHNHLICKHLQMHDIVYMLVVCPAC
jgi:hypothetical protein